MSETAAKPSEKAQETKVGLIDNDSEGRNNLAEAEAKIRSQQVSNVRSEIIDSIDRANIFCVLQLYPGIAHGAPRRGVSRRFADQL